MTGTTIAGEIRRRLAGTSVVGYAGWFLAAMFFFYAWVLRVSPSVMVEQLMRDFAVSGAVLGNLSACYFYSYVVMQMPVGIAVDRWGPRRVLSVAVLVAGAGCLIFAYAPNLAMAYLGRTLIGAGGAFGFVGSMVLAGAWFPPHRFAFLSGLSLAIGVLGGVSGQAPLALLVEAEGWRASMLMLAAGALVLSLLTWFITRDRPPGAAPPASAGPHGRAPILAALWQVARRPQTLVIALFTGLITGPALAFGGLWGVPYAMAAYGVSRPAAAFAVSSILIGFVVGGPMWGWVSDRIGLRKLPVIAAAVFCTATMAALLYIPELSFDAFRLLLFANGFGGGAMSVSYALAREHNPQGGSGAALGLVNMLAVASGAVLQPVIGLLLDLRWDGTTAAGARIYSLEAYADAFVVLPVLYGLAILIALLVRETRCRPV
jgi:MFS family permease